MNNNITGTQYVYFLEGYSRSEICFIATMFWRISSTSPLLQEVLRCQLPTHEGEKHLICFLALKFLPSHGGVKAWIYEY